MTRSIDAEGLDATDATETVDAEDTAGTETRSNGLARDAREDSDEDGRDTKADVDNREEDTLCARTKIKSGL